MVQFLKSFHIDQGSKARRRRPLRPWAVVKRKREHPLKGTYDECDWSVSLVFKYNKQNAVFSFCLGRTTEFQAASLLKEIGRMVSNH